MQHEMLAITQYMTGDYAIHNRLFRYMTADYEA
jgi:hypothetical protein